MYAIRRMLFSSSNNSININNSIDRKFVNGIVFRASGINGNTALCMCDTFCFQQSYVHCCPCSSICGHLPARSKNAVLSKKRAPTPLLTIIQQQQHENVTDLDHTEIHDLDFRFVLLLLHFKTTPLYYYF